PDTSLPRSTFDEDQPVEDEEIEELDLLDLEELEHIDEFVEAESAARDDAFEASFEDTFAEPAFEDTFAEPEVEEPVEEPVVESTGGSLFGRASVAQIEEMEDVHSDDDIMKASHATELS